MTSVCLSLSDQWRLQLPGRGEQVFSLLPDHTLPAALSQALAALPAKSALSVSVAGALARWLLLPHSPRLTSERAWLPFAQARFAQQFGVPAAEWTLRWWVEPPGHARLMAALPNALLAPLNQAAQRLRLSVEVQTCAHLATLRRTHPRFRGALLEANDAFSVLILCDQGRPIRVRKRAGAIDAPALAAMVKTEWASCVLPPSAPPSASDATPMCTHLAVAPAAWLDTSAMAHLQAQGFSQFTRLGAEVGR